MACCLASYGVTEKLNFTNIDQAVENFFSKEPDNKYSRPCGRILSLSHILCCLMCFDLIAPKNVKTSLSSQVIQNQARDRFGLLTTVCQALILINSRNTTFSAFNYKAVRSWHE
jgi:hypothetical protein